jgi:uncharacterized delta-60 repeat protein
MAVGAAARGAGFETLEDRTLFAVSGADLALSGVTYAPGQYVDGGSILVQATAVNNGTDPISGPLEFSLGLISDQPGSPEIDLGSTSVDQSLSAGQSTPLALTATIPGGTPSGHYFLAAHLTGGETLIGNGDVDPRNNDVVQSQADVVVAQLQFDSPMIGSFDPTFGTGGVVRQDTQLDTTAAVALQPDGKTIVVGNSKGTSNIDFGVTRFNADGSLDATFGGPAHGGPIAGTVFTDFGGRDDTPIAVAVQPDGKILVLGTSRAAGGTADADVALARYNSDGSLDTSFGTGGIVETNIGPDGAVTTDIARGLWLRGNGTFLICGQSNANGNGTDFLILRYDASGHLDSTFGNNGVVMTDFAGGDDGAYALAIDPKSGAIVSVGSTIEPGDGRRSMAIARYDTNGTPARNFGKGGIVITSISRADDQAYAVAMDRKLHVFVAGATASTDGSSFAVLKYTARGELDSHFGSDGISKIDFHQPAVANQISLDREGNILVSGATVTSLDSVDPSAVSVALAQLTPTGQTDPKFGAPGFNAGTNILNFDTTGSPGGLLRADAKPTMSPAAASDQVLDILAAQHAIAVMLGGKLVVVAAAGNQTAIGRVIGSGADIISTILSRLPDTVVSGYTRASANLTLSNNGNRATSGDLAMNLFLSLDPTVSDGDVPLASLGIRKINLKPAQIKVFKAKFLVPADLPEGNYFIVAKVDTTAPQIAMDNDNAATIGQSFIEAPFIDFSGPPLPNAPTLSAGDKSKISITLKNDGNITAKGTIELKVVAAVNSTPADSDAILADLQAVKLNLAPGAVKTLKIRIVVPADLAAGSYSLLATIGGALAANDPTPANNLLASPTPLIIS